MSIENRISEADWKHFAQFVESLAMQRGRKRWTLGCAVLGAITGLFGGSPKPTEDACLAKKEASLRFGLGLLVRRRCALLRRMGFDVWSTAPTVPTAAKLHHAGYRARLLNLAPSCAGVGCRPGPRRRSLAGERHVRKCRWLPPHRPKGEGALKDVPSRQTAKKISARRRASAPGPPTKPWSVPFR